MNLANVVFEIKTEVGMPTLACGTDVEEAVKGESGSDVLIDKAPITSEQSAPGADVDSSLIVLSESSSHEERGDPFAEMAWPPVCSTATRSLSY